MLIHFFRVKGFFPPLLLTNTEHDDAIKNPEPSCCYAPGLQTLLLVELVHGFCNALGNDHSGRLGCVHNG